MVSTSNDWGHRQRPEPSASDEKIFANALSAGLYEGPPLKEIPLVPRKRLLELLRALLPSTETIARSYRLTCSVEAVPYPTPSELEMVRFQQEHDTATMSSIDPERYAYVGHRQSVTLSVVERNSGNPSYIGATRVFSALSPRLLARITPSTCEHLASMGSYDILEAFLPVDRSEFSV